MPKLWSPIAFALVLIATPSLAGDVDRDIDAAATDRVVDRYLAAIVASDLEAMNALWTDDVVYADPTYGSRVEGREAVLEGLGTGMDQITDLELDVQTRFVSNGHAVLTYLGTATMTAANVQVSAPGVLVLRIEGDRVAEHIDYVDYATVQRQMAATGPASGDDS